MRLLCAAAVSLALGLFVSYAGDDKPNRPAKLTALKKKYDDELKEFKDRLKKATDPGEAKGIQAEIRELVAITAERALAIAKEDPKDDTGFAAAEFIVKAAGANNANGIKEVDSVIELLAEHHAANPKMKEMLVPVMRAGPAGDKLLLAVSEKSTDKETKGLALFIRGFKTARNAEEEDDDKELAAGIAKATELLEKAAAEAPDAKVGNSGKTVGEMAKKEIAGLKSIVIVAIGKPAPEVESVTLEGKKVKLSDYKGKVVLLDIWATWCPPCRKMIPHERDLVKSMKDKPFVLISASADDKKETLEKFIEKEPMPWVHWWDEGAESPVLKAYRVRAFPSLFLIDHSGIVREKWVGDPGSEKIDKAVEDLVKEAVKAKG
ncbi:MAG: TlpA family protein disulfide reductase [Planctomycetes bacterium]|nr:TlpA family protein disulfide reductase [Planctomycetota bacterium]